ncbi:MAG TPA: thioesterase family protein [Acidimicrobiia bacterium]|nr:thioesterase family protein [Acidimicrobiia bacterium]
MDGMAFFDLRRAEAPGRFEMPIVPSLCSGLGTLFGGCGLGALLEALEHESGRPTVWATAQYLDYARPPSVLDIEVNLAVEGRTVTQGRAIGRVDGREILTVNAALGRRESHLDGQWAVMPEVPPPDDCPPRVVQHRHVGTILERLDTRLADARNPEELPGPPGTGRSALWVRFTGLDMSAGALAIVGDYVPFGVSQASGQRAGGNSLDNTIRIANRVPTEWILADIRIHAVHAGFAHGLVHLWAQDGTLLGTASQSAMVRAWRDEPPAARTVGR